MSQANSNLAYLENLLARHRSNPTHLLQILRELQESRGWIDPESIDLLADRLDLPRARIEGVVGFYSFLHDKPVGQYRLLFSDNITDRMLGNQDLLEYLCHKLWAERGHVSEDGLVSIDTTSCTGLCDQGPAMLANGWAIPNLSRERLDRIAELVLAKTPVPQWPPELFGIENNIHRADILLGNSLQPGDALRAAIARGSTPDTEAAANARSWREANIPAALGPLATLEEIKRSNLRGRGGAGFTTGLKWEACRNAPGEPRYVVCNADEGEPGTFKDRVLLTAQADLLFEGMTVCAYAIDARQGFLYLRGEYRYLLEPLNAVLERRRAANLLGSNILNQTGFDFDIEIHLGAGAYVCGEESALIESLEGKRGIPRNRPPYPVTHGYLQKPTTVNNVETFCAAALVAFNGGDWYRGIGTVKSAGTKILSVSGDCARPGIYEYPFGVTVRQVLEDCGAGVAQHDTLAVQISGPSGVCIGADEFDRRIAFEDLATAGAFMVFDTRRDMFEVARNFVHFFAHESCGFCTPCRVGTAMLKATMDKIAAGHGTQYDLREIEQLDRVLNQSAHCGLGHTACNPTLDTLKRFRPTYERRLKSLDFEPAFDLDGALAAARRMTGRDDAGAHLNTESQA
jgi:[NiFe] hydrogenase diaphorase moiety large subunit